MSKSSRALRKKTRRMLRKARRAYQRRRLFSKKNFSKKQRGGNVLYPNFPDGGTKAGLMVNPDEEFDLDAVPRSNIPIKDEL